MRFPIFIFALLAILTSLRAQTTFLHTANSSNITANYTTLNHSELNDRPNAIVIVTSNWRTSGPYHNHSIGVFYSGGRWHIFNQNRSAMNNGAMFNVLVAAPSDRAFRVTGRAALRHTAVMDHPSLNGRPNARFLITPDWGTSGPYNNNAIGVWYNGSRWEVFNQNISQPMPANPIFNVWISDEVFEIEASSPNGNTTAFDNAATNSRPDALVFATQRWTNVYNPNEIGVFYSINRWAVFNQNLTAMPRGAKFFLWASAGGGTSAANCPTIPRSTWFVPLQNGLASASIRINNYTPNQNQYNPTGERAFHRPNDSYISINMGGGAPVRLPFNLDMYAGGPDNRCKAYINDWNSRYPVAVATNSSRLHIRLDFESEGTELVTNCYNNACCEGNPFCPGAGCPDYELDRAWIDLYLTPILSGGRLDYTSEVRFNVDVRELGNDPCTNSFWAFLCDWGLIPRVGDRQNIIRQAIEGALVAQVNSPLFRTAITTALNNATRAAGVDVSRCTSVSIDSAGNLVFR